MASEPVVVTLAGLPSETVREVSVYRLTNYQDEDYFPQIANQPVWSLPRNLVWGIRIRLPDAALPLLENVAIVIGARRFAFDRAHLTADWRRVDYRPVLGISGAPGFVTLEAPASVRGSGCMLAGYSDVLNCVDQPGSLYLQALYWAARWAALFFVVLLPARTRWGKRVAEAMLRPSARRQMPSLGNRSEIAWTALGLLLLAGALTFLEIRQPFYFTEDDNFAQFLPAITTSMRSIQAGHWPEWNPELLLGAPTTSAGTYAVTYPPTYFSYWIAKQVLGNEYLTMEVFCCLHLAAGFLVFASLLRRCGVRGPLRMVAALSFVLSGYALTVGRSWFYMCPVFLWAPLLMLALQFLRERKLGTGRIVVYGVGAGLFFHAGNAQMWVYGLAFFLLLSFGAVLVDGIPWRYALRLVPMLLIALAIAAPFLVVQAGFASDVTRPGGIGVAIPPNIWEMLMPNGHMFYANTLFCGAALAGIVALAAFRWKRDWIGANIWLVGAALALWLGIGDNGGLWVLLHWLPPFGKFNQPFKFLAYLDLFAILAGAAMVERVLSRPSAKWTRGMVAALAMACLACQVYLAKGSRFNYGDRPYPALDPAFVAAAGQSGRVLPFAAFRSSSTNYTSSLQHNFPTVYGVQSVTGYDPLVAMKPENRRLLARFVLDPVGAARAYGVRRVVITGSDNGAPSGWEVTPPSDLDEVSGQFRRLFNRLTLSQVRALSTPIYRSANLEVLDLPGADPLAFFESRRADPLTLELDSSGANVRFEPASTARRLVLNWLWRDRVRVGAGGQGLEASPDAWDRITIQVPPEITSLRVAYAPPWKAGFALSLLLLAAAGLSLAPLTRGYATSRWVHAEPSPDRESVNA